MAHTHKGVTIRRTLFGLLAAALGPVLIGTLLLLTQQWRSDHVKAQMRLHSQAQLLADAVDRELGGAEGRLRAASASSALRAGDWPGFHAFAQRAVSDWPAALITVTDAAGALRVNTGVPLGTPLPNLWALEQTGSEVVWQGRRLPLSSQGLTRRALQTDAVQYSGLFFGARVKQPYLAIAIPVQRDDGQRVALALSFPPQRLQALVAHAEVGDGGEVLITDLSGRVVAHSAGSRWHLADPLPLTAVKGAPAVRETDALGGDRMLLASVGAAGGVFTVSVMRSAAEIEAAAWRAALTWGSLALGAVALGAAVAVRLARQITQGLSGLQAAATGAPAAPRVSRIHEIDTVALALQHARERVAAHDREVAMRQAAEAQREAADAGERHLRHVMDRLFAFVGVLDTQGRLLEANDAPLTLAGIARTDVIGRWFWDCHWWTHDATVAAQLRAAITQAGEGTTVRYDAPVRMAHDQLITIDFQIAPLLDEGGRITHLIASGVDITSRVAALDALRLSEARAQEVAQQHERERRLLDTTLEAVPAGIAVADPQGRLIRANRALAQVWGDPPASESVEDYDQWQGWWADGSARHGQRVQAHEWPMARALRGEVCQDDMIEIQPFDQPGVRRVLLLSSAPVYDAAGHVMGAVTAQIDISERVAHEAALRNADRQKDAFLAVLAHELRNPLAPILTSAEWLAQRAPCPDDVAQRCHTILRQARTLSRLVDDLLDVSRISLGAVHLQRAPLDLRDAIAGAVDAVQPVAEARGVQLSVAPGGQPVTVEGDLTRLTQVIGNLRHNAVKFTPEGGRVTVALTCDGTAATVAVHDTGRGISPAMLETIFDWFTQEQRSGLAGNSGLGIGLALVRQLVTLHGGHVTAHSAGPGLGSTFTVCLPLAHADNAPSPVPTLVASTPQASLRVLVVDDNVDAAQSLSELLGLIGHRVQQAHCGQDAWKAATEVQFDAVILDIGLPDVSGYELAGRLRSSLPRVPMLIALSGWGQAQDKARALASGFDHHLTKPATLTTLTEILAAVR
jgi:PAS domain S-box-containing protein